MCIFPKGSRTARGDIMNPKSGADILLIKSNTPVVPILIDGALNTMSHMQTKFNFSKIRIAVGNPTDPPSGNAESKRLNRDAVDNWKNETMELQKGRL